MLVLFAVPCSTNILAISSRACRVRSPGCLRANCFIRCPSLKGWLESCESSVLLLLLLPLAHELLPQLDLSSLHFFFLLDK